jgi:hypothetical protein
MIAALMAVTYIPASSLWLPVQTGQVKAEDVEKCSFMNFEKPDPKKD